MKFYSLLKKTILCACVSLSALISTQISAALPEMTDPSQGKGGGWFDTIRGYIYDGAVVLSVLVVGATLFIVGRNVVSTYSEIQEKKSTWTQLAIQVTVGAVIIAVEIWLAYAAVDTLSST